ncbi:MAG: efflux RND transporter periplasmic adaptor subunit [Candidatus Zixiibacteriota bacterium]|nr:MAG: efflux RND transporter periplasmic adaptor subunit [candidate division Zixibacteria bacterium]
MPERLPKIRDDLVIREVRKADGLHYVIKDPITGAFFEVREPEYFIIRNFDGAKSFAQIVREFKDRFQLETDEKAIAGFVEKLQHLCFLDNDLARRELIRRQREATIDRKKTLLGRLVWFKLKAFDPGRLFDRLIKHVRFFFTGTFVWLALLLIVLASLVTLMNIREITVGIAGLISVRGIAILYVSTAVVILLHEFAHGLTCKYFGGDVRDIGFLLMYFQPCFYCNVSDAWLFPRKSQRIWVSFSGGFFQLFLWSVSVFVWRVTQTDTIISQVAIAVMSFSGIASLFNFNPLLRFDGYYMLSDFVEIPNLRTKAAGYWRALLKGVFLSARAELPEYRPREKRIFFYYGIFSFIYVVFILGYFFYIVGCFLVDQLGGTGAVIFAAILVFLFRNIIVDTTRGIAAFVRARSEFFRRRITLSVILLVIVLAVLIAAFGSRQLRVKGELELEPSRVLVLKYSSFGYVELIRQDNTGSNPGTRRDVNVFGGDYNTTRLIPLVAPGESIVADQVIARLVNAETDQMISQYAAMLTKEQEELALLIKGPRNEEIEEARNNVTELEAQLDASGRELQRKRQMYQKELIARQLMEDAYTDSVIWQARLESARNRLHILLAGTRPEEIKAKKAEIERLTGLIDFHTGRQEFNEIKSTVNGMVLAVDTGEVACEIASVDTLVALISLSEKDLADIDIEQKVKFKARSYPSLSFFGTVFRIDRKVITGRDGRRVIRVFCLVSNPEHLLKPGMTGIANIYCGKRSISYLVYRKFFRTIRTEFWDWFDWS